MLARFLRRTRRPRNLERSFRPHLPSRLEDRAVPSGLVRPLTSPIAVHQVFQRQAVTPRTPGGINFNVPNGGRIPGAASAINLEAFPAGGVSTGFAATSGLAFNNGLGTPVPSLASAAAQQATNGLVFNNGLGTPTTSALNTFSLPVTTGLSFNNGLGAAIPQTGANAEVSSGLAFNNGLGNPFPNFGPTTFSTGVSNGLVFNSGLGLSSAVNNPFVNIPLTSSALNSSTANNGFGNPFSFTNGLGFISSGALGGATSTTNGLSGLPLAINNGAGGMLVI